MNSYFVQVTAALLNSSGHQSVTLRHAFGKYEYDVISERYEGIVDFPEKVDSSRPAGQ